MHTASLGHRPLEHPLGQRRLAQGAPGIYVLLDHGGHLQPAGLLPELERPLLETEAPAHGQVHVARRFGHRMQVHGGVVELVAQNRPEEARLGAFGVAQQLQALGGRLLEHAAHHLVSLGAAGHIVARTVGGRGVKTQDVAPDFLVETGPGFLPQVAQGHELGQHRRGAEVAVERVALQAQVVLKRLDHVGHGVEPHHVGSAERTGAGAPQFLAGEVVHHVVRQAEVLHLLHRGQHAGDADAVGDEVGRVMRAHHALAQAAGDKRFQVIEHVGLGGGGIDQLHQRHVARRVEEMDAAKARLDGLGQSLAEFGDRQARGIGRHDCVRCQKRRNFAVQVQLPVHALGNRFDHQVALFKLLHVFFVIRLPNQVRILRHTERCGL